MNDNIFEYTMTSNLGTTIDFGDHTKVFVSSRHYLIVDFNASSKTEKLDITIVVESKLPAAKQSEALEIPLAERTIAVEEVVITFQDSDSKNGSSLKVDGKQVFKHEVQTFDWKSDIFERTDRMYKEIVLNQPQDNTVETKKQPELVLSLNVNKFSDISATFGKDKKKASLNITYKHNPNLVIGK